MTDRPQPSELQSQIQYRLIEELADADAKLSDVLSAIDAVVVRCDTEGRIVSANQTWWSLVQSNPEVSTGLSLTAFAHPTQQERLRKALRRSTTRFDLRLICPPNVWLSIGIRVAPDGRATAIGFDVTARRTVEAVSDCIRRLEVLRRQVTGLLLQGDCDEPLIVSLANLITAVLPMAEVWLIRTEGAEGPVRVLPEGRPPPGAADVALALARQTDENSTLAIEEGFTLMRLGEHENPWGLLLMRHVDGKHGRLMAQHPDLVEPALRDIIASVGASLARARATRALREALRDAQAAKAFRQEAATLREKFTASASHELRTPMASIMGFAELLGATDCSPKQRAEYAAIMVEQIQHMASLIEKLTLSSPTTEQPTPASTHKVDLSNEVTNAAARLAERVQEAELTLNVKLPAAPTWIVGDSKRLQQALEHLVNNSIQYTPPGGSITLCVAVSSPDTVILTVQDSGIGMSDHDLAHVTDPFYRGTGQSDSAPGSGLGLSIVQQLLLAHGARMVIDSAPGAGTTVRAEFSLVS